MILDKNRTSGGAFDATLRRAEALNERCKALSLWQFTLALHDASHSVAMRLWKVDGSIEVCDRGIAELDVQMCEAERSPKMSGDWFDVHAWADRYHAQLNARVKKELAAEAAVEAARARELEQQRVLGR